MENALNLLKCLIALMSGVIAYIYGGTGNMLFILVLFVICDYITGFLCAIAQKKLNSAIGFKGIARKVFIFVIVGMAALLERLMPDVHGALHVAVCGFYIANEGLSILENAGKLGLKLPDSLKKALTQLNKHEGEKNE